MRKPNLPQAPAHSVPVYPAEVFTATDGANMGDALSFADELELDDTYALSPQARPVQLAIQVLEDGFEIAAESATGVPGAALHLDCALTLMSPDGQTTDSIVVVETDATGNVAQIYLLPLASLTPRTDYALVGIDTTKAAEKFAEVACARFTRGTHITLASGAQVPIEDLSVGDRVLTRDDGPQKVRWIGQSTVRAVGDFAPICIRRRRAEQLQRSGGQPRPPPVHLSTLGPIGRRPVRAAGQGASSGQRRHRDPAGRRICRLFPAAL